jgi:hypothetical protein
VREVDEHLRGGMHNAHLVQHGGSVICDDGLAFAGLDLGESAVMARDLRLSRTILSMPFGPKDCQKVSIRRFPAPRGGTYSSDRICHSYNV